MRVLIAGVDGYLGWALAQFLTLRGHEVGGIDALLRRDWVSEVGSISALPVASIDDRLHAFQEVYGLPLNFYRGDLLDYGFVSGVYEAFRPEAIVHLAEVPSAPYSMIDPAHTAFTQQNNIVGTLNVLWAMQQHAPDAHLVKLGTMGEYGTPNLDIPEGFFEVEFRGRRDTLPFPRQAGSFYHWSKVHDSNNVMFACKIWGLRSTDVMQGVVYGTRFEGMPDDPRLKTRLDFDQCFGTAINRFACQAVIGHPLTVFGGGGQRRGFLPLHDSMLCLSLAIENPPARGEYRVVNQFEETYSIQALAEIVQQAATAHGLDTCIRHYENPRIEAAEHYYNPDRDRLVALGYTPRHNIAADLDVMLHDLLPHRERIVGYRQVLVPDIRWDTHHHRSTTIDEF
jgi:UDP-sulfoquinovose synthase